MTTHEGPAELLLEPGGIAPHVFPELPDILADAGPLAVKRTFEFFGAEIANPNTRAAYARAAGRFFRWCDDRGLALAAVEPLHVRAYLVRLEHDGLSAPTIKQHRAALKRLFDYLIVGQVVAVNPVAAVRGPSHTVRKGKTPVLFSEEFRELVDAIETDGVVGLRDRALISVMTYSFARIGAVLAMNVEDYRVQGRLAYFRLHEKGGKYLENVAHHQAAEDVEAYLEAGGLVDDPKGPLWRSAPGRGGKLTERRLGRDAALAMVKRRARAAGLGDKICNHTFRATGITNYREHGGSLEVAAEMAGHASTRTTQVYDRSRDKVTQAEVERIRF